MSVANGFPQISGIFFSIFDAQQGSKPKCQVPDGAVLRTATSEVVEPLIPFDAIKNYIIPKPVLCNRLVSIHCNGFRIIGYPVNIPGDHYERNSFTFNLAFIFAADADTSPYEGVISRTAKMLRALEEQSRYVSDLKNLVALDGAVEQMFQDLNSFSECQIPIDASNKLDIKLFPIIEAPPELHGYDVPIITVKIGSLVDETWDPTLERLLPYINGANSIRRIADLASADFKLTVKAIQHLVHYGCVVILGIFQFGNIYAPTSSVADICDPQIFQEFCYYVYNYKHRGKTIPRRGSGSFNANSRVNIPGSTPGSGIGSALSSSVAVGSLAGSVNVSGSGHRGSHTDVRPSSPGSYPSAHLSESTGSNRGSLYRHHRTSQATTGTTYSVVGPASVLSLKQVFNLYSSFHVGLPLSQWCLNNRDLLQDIDLNRFIAFGQLKRLIYQAHSYPMPISFRHPPSKPKIEDCLESYGISPEHADLISMCYEKPIHLDELCNELRENRAVVTQILKSLGDWALVNI